MARRADAGGTGVHLEFGADPATSMVVSWLTDGPVRRAAVRFAPLEAGEGRKGRAHAQTRAYRDDRRQRVHVQHATLRGLRPDTRYRYEIEGGLAGPEPFTGEFRTAPAPGAEAAFTFTCFGDHGTDQPDDPFGTPASGEVVAAVEARAPLFNLVLGDLSYASLRHDSARVWADWFRMISPSARRRPWLPVAGNHESEHGVGRFGLDAYQAYFQTPDNGCGEAFRGLWYAFTVGRARFVVLFGEDVCYQDHGEVYLRGFSHGRQTAWLDRTLRSARADPAVDWIVVAVHQVAMSTANYHNGGDLGLREEWLPLFDRHEVDLVLCGHEHHYERTHPVRGVVPGSPALTPRPGAVPAVVAAGPSPTAPTAAARSAVAEPEQVDTTAGAVHVIVGTGGSSSPSAQVLLEPPAGRVVVGVDAQSGRRRARYALEEAPWLAMRSPDHPYAFAELSVDPGTPGGLTTIRLTARDSLAPDAPPFDEVVLTRPRGSTAQTAAQSAN
ncbi:fibronectin type III domain-containing protein [Frankia nepalensis]|uniref:fibronectin type III domain-containing protein n=1 Tax=Frankia nepalensis TaxID=1836974 RepID=UPI0027DB6FE9|nr:fibronectin type III domain-containing protein [Frankia nepalensis]